MTSKTRATSLGSKWIDRFSYEGQTVGTAKQQNFGEVGAKATKGFPGEPKWGDAIYRQRTWTWPKAVSFRIDMLSKMAHLQLLPF